MSHSSIRSRRRAANNLKPAKKPDPKSKKKANVPKKVAKKPVTPKSSSEEVAPKPKPVRKRHTKKTAE